MRYVAPLLLCLSLFHYVAPAQKRSWSGSPAMPDPVADFDRYVAQAVQDWRVPGLTVTVIKDGNVLFKKGYGVRDTKSQLPVNTKTQFAMASTTKAMTAAALGVLVDEGKLRWDDRVVDHIPEFQLMDPATTREVRVRDLLTHNAGLPNADFLWAGWQLSPPAILQRLKLIKPAYSLRSHFIYQNIMYLVAGQVLERVGGQPWETFMKERLFQPLGMGRTVAFFRDADDANRARPHVLVADSVKFMPSRIEESLVDGVGPAGSVWTCADDVALWMQCMLDTARYGEGTSRKALLTPQTWAELFRPQAMVPPAQFYPTARLTHPHWTTYALGWFQHDYRGEKVNFHTGSLTGMVAIHGQLPAHRLAVYVQGNLDHAEVRHALLYRAFDQFALGPVAPVTTFATKKRSRNVAPAPALRDWSREFKALYDSLGVQQKTAIQKAETRRIAGTKPSVDVAKLIGRYVDPLWGSAVISLKDGQPYLVYNDLWGGRLEHWHYDTYRIRYDQFWNNLAPPDLITFPIGASGQPTVLDFGPGTLRRE